MIYDVKNDVVYHFSVYTALSLFKLCLFFLLIRRAMVPLGLHLFRDEGILGVWLKKASVNDGFLEFPVRLV